ncbi:MAG: sigma-70 family RNA polymerase sigma factor [Bdellovibrionota bacterium]
MNQLLAKWTLNQPMKVEQDHPAFRRLYDNYAGLVRSLLFKLCGAEDLDDAVQEVFVKVWKGLERFQGESNHKTWIYRITFNHAMDRLRKRRPAPLPFIESMAGSTEPTDTEWLQKGLSTLSSDHRSVLVLHCMEGLSLEDVAKVTEVPVGTVKSRLHFARKQLHTFLQKQG